MAIEQKYVVSWNGKIARSKKQNAPMLLITYDLLDGGVVRQYLCVEHSSQFALRKVRDFFTTFGAKVPQRTEEALATWQTLPRPSAINVEAQGNGQYEIEGYKFDAPSVEDPAPRAPAASQSSKQRAASIIAALRKSVDDLANFLEAS